MIDDRHKRGIRRLSVHKKKSELCGNNRNVQYASWIAKLCRKTPTWRQQLCQVIFSDEKKSNLCGRDDNRRYWYDLRRSRESRHRCKFGGDK